MESTTINQILAGNKETKKLYIGCYPCDRLPKLLDHQQKTPFSLVANNDPASKKGTHWVAMFAQDLDTIFYFDSLGAEPNRCIQVFLQQFKQVTRNNKIVQSISSSACGYYCIYFIYNMCSSNPKEYKRRFISLVRKLTSLEDPDFYVTKFVHNFVSTKNG